MDVMEFNPVKRENTRGRLLGRDEIGAAPDFLSGFKCPFAFSGQVGALQSPPPPNRAALS